MCAACFTVFVGSGKRFVWTPQICLKVKTWFKGLNSVVMVKVGGLGVHYINDGSPRIQKSEDVCMQIAA